MKDWKQQLWTSNTPCEFIEIGLSALLLNATHPDSNAIENGTSLFLVFVKIQKSYPDPYFFPYT